MRVAIAGGSGFIGRELTRQLLAEGTGVVWLSRRPARTAAPSGVDQVHFNHHDVDGAWTAEVSAADAVINLSGHPIASRWNARVKHALHDSRIGTNRALVRALGGAAEGEPGRDRVFISASGIGYYGDRGTEVLEEDARAGTDYLARLAAEWEASALEATRSAGARVACVRTGLVLGEEGLVPRLALPMRLFAGGPVGLRARTQWVGWIHIEDIAGAYRHILHSPDLAGPLNAVAPEPVTMHGLAAALGRAMHRPSWLPVPGPALRLVLGEVAPYMLFSQRALPGVLSRTGYRHHHPEIVEALSDALDRVSTR